jgi:quercetin dioxygenase-like cupin family protein
MSHFSENSNGESTPSLSSTLFEWNRLKCIDTPQGEFRPMVDAASPPFPRVEMHATMLRPGLTSHEPHQHPQEEIIWVKEGLVESWINGKKTRLGPGSLLFFATYDLHGLTNVGTAPASYYVMNFYTGASEALSSLDPSLVVNTKRFPSQAIDWNHIAATETEQGQSREFVRSSTSTLGLFEVCAYTVRQGSTIPPLQTPCAKIVVLIEGVMEIGMGEQWSPLNPGALAYITGGERLRLKNQGPGSATYVILSFSPHSSPEVTA